MQLGGTLKWNGVRYFISMTENKNTVSWFLISEYHKEDMHVLVTGELPKHPVLTEGMIARKHVPVGYVTEAITKQKVSGKTKVANGHFILGEVIKIIADSKAYNFDPELVRQSKHNNLGISYHEFEAQDDQMLLRFSRINNEYYEELELKYGDIHLNISQAMKVRVNPKLLDFEEIKQKDGGTPVFLTTKSLDYESLKEVLDLSWYEENGVVKKDYRPITNIAEFETYVMDSLMAAYNAAVRAGKKLKFACDTETTGFIFYDLSPDNEELDDLVAIPLSWEDDQGVVIFIDMEYFNNVPLDYVIHRLRDFWETRKGNVTIEQRGKFNKGLHTDVREMHSFGTNLSADDSEDLKWEKVGEWEFNRDNIELIGHNILFDGRVLYHYGIKTEWDHDTLQMSFNLNPKVVKGSNKLKTLTRKIWGHETPELSDVLGKGNEDKYRYISDIRVATIYGCADTDYTRMLQPYLAGLMGEKMVKQYQKQDVQMMNILYMSEYHGMRADEEMLKARAEVAEADLQRIKEFLFNYVGVAVDLRNKIEVLRKALELGEISPEQYAQKVKTIKPDENAVHEFEMKGNSIRKVIYDILEYPIKGWTKDEKNKQPSVDKFVMKKLQRYTWDKPKNVLKGDIYSTDPAEAHLPNEKRTVLIEAKKFNKLQFPVAYVLAKYGELNKEWTSYYKPLRDQNLEGKIFKNYSLARIETRRIMNPGQTMKGDLKALIKPYNEDYYLCDFDQSQVEYRIMASLAKFTEIIKKMNDPEKDYHTETASDVHGVPSHKVSKYLRKQTKGISFGVPYGLGDHKMTENLFGEVNDETLTKTRFMLHDYKKKNKPIIDLLNDYKTTAIKPVNDLSPELRRFMKLKEDDPDDIPYGKVTGKLGFYRFFDLRDLDNKKKGSIQRPAGNYPIQNFAAELFRMVLTRFYNRCVQEGIADKLIWHMLIHDELLFSVHKSVHPFYLYKLLYESCVVTIKDHTKYFIGINIGDTWADCKKDSNEAPIIFVKRIIDRWDAGEFRDDDYQTNVKQYVLDHKQQFIKERVGEVVRDIQPNVDNEPIDLKHLLDNFTNYTVRSYVSDFFPMNHKVENPREEANADKVWVSQFESWVIEYFGEGKEMRYEDGTLRKVMYDDSEIIEFSFDEEEEDDGPEDAFWSFDEDGMSEGQEELFGYTEYELDDEDDLLSEFAENHSGAKSVADLWIGKAPSYKYVKVLNKKLIIKVDRERYIEKIKSQLLRSEDKEGYTVVFETPLERQHWLKVDSNVSLEEIDNFIKELK